MLPKKGVWILIIVDRLMNKKKDINFLPRDYPYSLNVSDWLKSFSNSNFIIENIYLKAKLKSLLLIFYKGF